MLPTRALVPALALAALALGACTSAGRGADGRDGATSGPQGPASPTGSTPVLPDGQDGLGGAGDSGALTRPGSELRLGESAILPFSAGDGDSRVRLAVERIERGSAADLAELGLGDQADGYVPYYVRFSVTGVAGSDDLASRSINESVKGVLDDGAAAQTLYVIGDWDHCTAVSFPPGFVDGRTISSCVPYLAAEPEAVTTAVFAPPTGAYSSAEGNPVRWR
ncbi:hypothetical protein [Nocardioides sp. YIM 152588]|uniref:hypothetical protein n=1 Tax=Nocardioides sp. YIM 152588 TaxID=3158259 RepID=UPI0032E43512